MGKQLTALAEFLTISSISVVGLALGGTALPPISIIGTIIGNTGINLQSNKIQQIKDKFFSSDDGIHNHDIQKALNRAFIKTLKSLEGKYLAERRGPETHSNILLKNEIESITSFFDDLNRNTQTFFNSVNEQDLVNCSSYIYETPEAITDKIREHISNINLTDDQKNWFINFFLEQRFYKEVLLHFFEELKKDTPECTRAWRAFQRLILDGIQSHVKTIQTNQESMQKKIDEIRELLKQQTDSRLPNDPFENGLNDAIHKMLEEMHEALKDIAKTGHRTEKKMDAAKETIDSIKASMEELYPCILARIPISLQRFMTLDVYLSSSNQRFWPKWKDIQEGKLYFSESYIKEIENKLFECGRCLLTGASGSGKSAQAIAFGLWWYGNVNISKHPEAVVSYLDASTGYTAENGEDWYREVLAHDNHTGLFIIDNCHLGTLAVNAFCYQWERKRPEHALVLLISTPKVSDSPWEDEPEDYFDSFEQVKAIVSVQPEQIYKGILRKYSDAYKRINPQRFISVEDDLSDLNRTGKLDRLCSHNLAVARSILEAWSDVGGWLSDVTEEVALGNLARRYLTDKKAPALAPLCSLGQFEILIHDRFIRHLPQESVNALSKENLIVPEDSPLYGRCHKVSFHPQVAALIFRAYLYRQMGSGFEKRIDDEIFQILKKYLSYYPENFQEVYYRLYRADASELEHRLLRDAELQTYAFQQFTTRPLDEVIWYLYELYGIHPDKAKSLLQGFLNQITVEKLQKEILALTGTQFNIVNLSLNKINPDISHQVLGKLLANRILKSWNLNKIGAWIRPTSSSKGTKLGYSLAWRQQIVKMFDLDDLVEMALKENPQYLYWFIDAFIDIDKERAKLFVDKLSPERLGRIFSVQHLFLIHRGLNLLKNLGYDLAFCKRFVTMFDITSLFINAKDLSLLNLYWILRYLKDVDPEFVEQFFKNITPAGLADMFRNKQGTAQNILDFLRVSDPQFKREFMRQLGDEEIVAIFRRSKLGEIGTLQENYFRQLEQPYSIFAAQSLHNLLAKQEISEIGKFIARLQRVPKQGQRLAVQALELLLKTDLAHRVAESEIEDFSLLLFNTYSVNPNYPNRILSALAPSNAVEKSLQHSGIRGIQLLLSNLSKMAPEFLPRITKSLQTLDLSDKIMESEIIDLGYFLWNIRAYVGVELAQNYCRIVDSKLRSEQIADANLTDLGSFLWNLVHISDMDELRTLNMPVLKERLLKEWETNPGQCISIFGIIVVTCPESSTYLNISALDIDRMSGRLTVWLTEQLNAGHPYTFVLTVKSLQVLDECRTVEIVRNSLLKESIMDKYLKQIREAMAKAVTPRSKAVLEDNIKFIQQIRN